MVVTNADAQKKNVTWSLKIYAASVRKIHH